MHGGACKACSILWREEGSLGGQFVKKSLLLKYLSRIVVEEKDHDAVVDRYFQIQPWDESL